jgi:hypothetical protein
MGNGYVKPNFKTDVSGAASHTWTKLTPEVIIPRDLLFNIEKFN